MVNSPVAVYAYNYSWQELLGITEDADAAVNSGLWVQYGLRTLGPGDTEYFKGVETINDTVTGNVVYCNIVYKESRTIRRIVFRFCQAMSYVLW